MNEHLTPIRSERGFAQLLPIRSEYGGEMSVYESSAASGPHIWLKAREAMRGEPERTAALHLTAENAWRLADQLRYLVRNHYQGDMTPSWATLSELHRLLTPDARGGTDGPPDAIGPEIN